MIRQRFLISFTRVNMIVACILYSVQATTQYKYDYTWLTGIEQSDLYGQSKFEFKSDTLKVSLDLLPFAFSEMNSCISDEDGNLMLYFNGCDISNRNHEILENGSGFNEGVIGNWECPKNYGYPGAYQSALILPKPGSGGIFYVFHINDIFVGQSIKTSLLYSVVIIDGVSDRGRVILKNQQALQDSFVTSAGLTAVRHVDNESWWIILARQHGGKYSRILLTKDGTIEYPDIKIGIDSLQSGGQASFSPDGTKYFRYTSIGLTVMDFDRNIGTFKNSKELFFKPIGIWSGGTFSPNSRFIYLSNRDKIYQVDTWEEELSLDVVEVWDGVKYNGWTVSFSMMQTGPDCRIYISSVSCLPLVHIIMNPDEKGVACNVVQRALELKSSCCGFPHFPNFRLGTSEPYCDPDKVVITSINTQIDEAPNVKIHPNPSSGDFMITSEDVIRSVDVYDIYGQKIAHQITDTFQTNISLHHQNSGVYFVHIRYKNRMRHVVRKIVLMP